MLCPAGMRPAGPGNLPDNAFGYIADDRYGQGCPMGSHVRRANPRDGLAKDHPAAAQTLLEPLTRSGNENPYSIHADLQECMQALVGIIRTEGELRKALEEIAVFKQRLGRVRVGGGREFNPGWHLALDLHSMLSVSEAVTLGAIERKESRGGHTRDDYPFADDRFGKINVVIRRKNGQLTVAQEPLPEMPDELKQLLQERK